MPVIRLLTLLCSALLIGCFNPDDDLRVLKADVVIQDGLPYLEVCFNREFTTPIISDVKITTKDGHVFGRNDMYMSFDNTLKKDKCLYEEPYFFLRNTRDDELRDQFIESMKPKNIKKIEIKLGSVAVEFMYSDRFALTAYSRTF